jgi:hypothetical protein
VPVVSSFVIIHGVTPVVKSFFDFFKKFFQRRASSTVSGDEVEISLILSITVWRRHFIPCVPVFSPHCQNQPNPPAAEYPNLT